MLVSSRLIKKNLKEQFITFFFFAGSFWHSLFFFKCAFPQWLWIFFVITFWPQNHHILSSFHCLNQPNILELLISSTTKPPLRFSWSATMWQRMLCFPSFRKGNPVILMFADIRWVLILPFHTEGNIDFNLSAQRETERESSSLIWWCRTI